MPLRLGSVLLLVFQIARAAAAQGPPPPLPRLAFELFPEAARAAVSRAYEEAKARSTDPKAVGALARLLQAWEQWDAAHEAYLRAQQLAPKTFEWHYLDAVVLQRLARHSEAAAHLKDAVAIAPDFKPARVKLADALFEAGDVQESRKVFEALAADAETEPMGQFGLGRIAAAEKRHEAAIEHFQRAVARFPEWGSAYYALALSYRALGKREEAAGALERHAQYGPRWPALEDPVLAAVSTVRDDARATLQRGIALAERGDLEGAIEAHESALAKDPTLEDAHTNLISLYGRQKQWAKAEAHYQAALRLGGDLGDAHYDYGVLLGMQEKWDAAADAYRKALAANPLHVRAQNNLGEVFERQRQLERRARRLPPRGRDSAALPPRPFQRGTHADAARQAGGGRGGARKDRRAARCGGAALSVRAVGRLRSGRAERGRHQVGDRRPATGAPARPARAGGSHRTGSGQV